MPLSMSDRCFSLSLSLYDATVKLRPAHSTEMRVKQEPVGGGSAGVELTCAEQEEMGRSRTLVREVSGQQLEVAGGTDRRMAGRSGNRRQKRWAAASVFTHPPSTSL